ncbi:transmembrane protein 45B [Exaiptasia diaphana]|uniref:Uncharacterized protein n=1 Tax=Exaiptasia diaphana TaxID=2652724 RepID=A0A913XJ15_EXADI|nr:transmembrane protein 45B [Exaiptasia diaphana]
MYGSFMMWSLVEVLQFYRLTRLPQCIEHVFASIAFLNVGFLFFFHLQGRTEIDKVFHHVVMVITFTSAVVFLLEAWRKNSFLLMVIRTALFGLQGTWVFQIAFSLYVAKPWKNTRGNREFVGIVATWHVMGAMALIITGFVVITIKTQGIRRRAVGEGLEDGDDNEEKESLLNVQ